MEPKCAVLRPLGHKRARAGNSQIRSAGARQTTHAHATNMAAVAAAQPQLDLNALPVLHNEFEAAGHAALQQNQNHQDLQDVDYDVIDNPASGDEDVRGPAAAPAVPVPPPGGFGVAIGVRFRTLDHADLHIARWFNRTRKRLKRGSSRATRKLFTCVARCCSPRVHCNHQRSSLM